MGRNMTIGHLPLLRMDTLGWRWVLLRSNAAEKLTVSELLCLNDALDASTEAK